MAFHKIQKTSSWSSRYQTPFRRRRTGQTDYKQRRRLVEQNKAKYASKKYRLVVRFSNKDITCQIISSQLNGDVVFASAYSHELKGYGLKHGLASWSAAYATGLLVARRALKKLGLDETYAGDDEHSGEFSITEAVEDGPRPFKVFLDVGLQRTTCGARVFGALKGASDGGLYIPHSPKIFPGYDIETEELDAEVLQKYIVGGHIAEYMEELADDDEERYQQIFASYLKDDFTPETLEDIYSGMHEKIRENPERVLTKKDKEAYKAEGKKYLQKKISRAERKEKIQARITAFAKEQHEQ